MIGEKIKALRLSKNLSQKELAVKSNLHQCQISKIENGSRKIKADELFLVARALEIDLSTLLDSA